MSSGIIIIDTNSLIYAIRNRVDIRSQLLSFPEISSIMIPQCVLNELSGLSSRIPEASGALKMAANFEHVDSEGSGDECVLNAAIARKAAILTNDRELRDRARAKGIRTFSIRGKNRIDVSL
ncbi:MAG: hypothetical protein QXN26_03040 [Thermoplasmataceae archaeon]